MSEWPRSYLPWTNKKNVVSESRRAPEFETKMGLPARTNYQMCDKVSDGSSRIRPSPVPRAVRPPLPSPEGKGGALWQRMFDAAFKSGHPEPEKMADTMLLSRERALALQAARHKTLITKEVPKPQEQVVAPKKGRSVLTDAARCKATTLEGRRCGFKATCGLFCKKHAVEKC